MTFSVPLDALRSLSSAFLPDPASISRPTTTSDGEGTSSTWTTIATGVPCRLSPIGGGATEAVAASARVEATNQWTAWLPAATDVTVRDRLLVGSRAFEVLRVGARSYEVVRECSCREVT